MKRLSAMGALAALAMAGIGLTPVATASAPTEKATTPTPRRETAPKKKRLLRTPSGRFFQPIRSRGPQAQKKKRPNLNHISKRVRRKHRRAA